MAVSDVVDEAPEEFADILCSDPEWLDAEFERIVSGFWDEPPSTATRPGSPSVATHVAGGPRGQFLGDQWSAETSATIRSPP